MDNINIKTEKLRNALYAIVNESKLPIANVYFVYKDVFKDLEELYENVINKELVGQQEEQKEEKEQEEEILEEE